MQVDLRKLSQGSARKRTLRDALGTQTPPPALPPPKKQVRNSSFASGSLFLGGNVWHLGLNENQKDPNPYFGHSTGKWRLTHQNQWGHASSTDDPKPKARRMLGAVQSEQAFKDSVEPEWG